MPVRGVLRAALAVHPAGVAVLVVLLLPDGQPVLDLIDDVAAGAKRLVTMAGRHADPDRALADLERAGPMHARGVLHAEARDRFRDDPLAFPDRERLEGFILQPAHAPALVVIAHPALEGGVAAASRIAELRAQGGLIEGSGGEAECHVSVPHWLWAVPLAVRGGGPSGPAQSEEPHDRCSAVRGTL